MTNHKVRSGALLAIAALLTCPSVSAQEKAPATRSIEIPFTTHDGYPMLGKLTLPSSSGAHAVVIYVQTAEGMTIDMKRPGGRTGTFNYFDIYRDRLPAMNVGFFSYEGRGIKMGDKPPRYEAIDWDVYNTSMLDNKVRDVLSAVQLIKKQPGIDASRIFLMGASEGTLLATEAAARAPKEVRGLILYGVMSVNMRDAFRYVMDGGGYLAYLGFFDKDKDGRISKAEFEADPYQYRAQVWNNAGFEHFDRNGDGYFSADEMKFLTQPYLDAVDHENFEVLDAWAKAGAGVSTPKGWFKDHFAQPVMWTFVSKLDMPIGMFQGADDSAVPIAGVRKMEQQAKEAGKTKIEFHYFDGLDHTLAVGNYFRSGKIPAGHQAIFDFIARQTADQPESH